jgi:ribonuclease III
MSPRPSAKRTPAVKERSAPPAGGDPGSRPVAADTPAPGQAKRPRRASGLETRIGYRFGDSALLDQALTHISALTGARNRSGSYQRLEFLGDHVLGLVVSDMLFRAFPRADEGELSRRLADLVRKEACADVATSIELGAAIRLGASESNAGGRSRVAILADVCEALIGAVFVDGGYEAAAALITRLWEQRMRAPSGPCATPRPCCRNGRRGRGCRRLPIARSSAPAPTTTRSSASPSSCPISCRRREPAAPSAPPSRLPRRSC